MGFNLLRGDFSFATSRVLGMARQLFPPERFNLLRGDFSFATGENHRRRAAPYRGGFNLLRGDFSFATRYVVPEDRIGDTTEVSISFAEIFLLQPSTVFILLYLRKRKGVRRSLMGRTVRKPRGGGDPAGGGLTS